MMTKSMAGLVASLMGVQRGNVGIYPRERVMIIGSVEMAAAKELETLGVARIEQDDNHVWLVRTYPKRD